MSSDTSEGELDGLPPALRALISDFASQLEDKDRQITALVREVETLSHRVSMLEAAGSPLETSMQGNGRGGGRMMKTLVRRNSGNNLDKKAASPQQDMKLPVSVSSSGIAASASAMASSTTSTPKKVLRRSLTSSDSLDSFSPRKSPLSTNMPRKVSSGSALEESFLSKPNFSRQSSDSEDREPVRSSLSGHRDFVPESSPRSCKIFTHTRQVNVWQPGSIPPEATNPSAPEHQLKLSAVYGYQGKKCHDNLFELPSGEILYNMSNVCILLNADSGAQRHYLAHQQEVKCIALHPSRTVVATGEMNAPNGGPLRAHVRIWDPESLETKHILGQNDFVKGVGLLQFSPIEEDILVSIDENAQHTMIMWDWVNAVKLGEVLIGPEAVFTIDFNPVTRKLVTGGAKGFLYFWSSEAIEDEMEEGPRIKLTKKPGLFTPHEKPKAILCVCFSPQGDTVTGDSNGHLYVWPPPVPSHVISQTLLNAHKGGVFALCGTDDGFLSGGKDGTIKVWTWSYELFHVSGDEQNTIKIGGCIRTISPLYTEDNVRSLSQFFAGTFENSIYSVDAGLGRVENIMEGHYGQLSSLVVDPQQHEAVFTASHDGCIRRWDLQQKRLAWRTEVNIEEAGEPHCLAFSESAVAVGTHAGFLLLISLQGNVLEELRVWRTGITCAQFSPDQTMLALGSDDGCILLFNMQVSPPTRLSLFKMLNTRVIEVGWSADSLFVRATLLDHDVWYWSVREQAPAFVDDVRDTVWATACRVGWDVNGVWNCIADGAGDINAVSVSANKDLVVLGDASMKVRMYRYPCLSPRSAGRAYTGHAGSVESVSFALGDTCVVSTGGLDMGLFQWQVCEADGRARVIQSERASPTRL